VAARGRHEGRPKALKSLETIAFGVQNMKFGVGTALAMSCA
jgi:hypothetical protein